MRATAILIAGCLMFAFLVGVFIPTAEGSTIIYTFSVASDGHIGETMPNGTNWNGERNQVLADSVVANGAQRHFETGDILDETTEYELYPTVRAIYDAMGIPYHLVCGNHDNPSEFLDAFGYDSLHYNVTHGDIVWLMMNSREHFLPAGPVEMNATQLQYIDDALNYYSDKLVFIMLHINHIQLSYPEIEVDSPTFQASVEAHADHIGGVFVGHSHNWQAMTYDVNSVRYSNAGTYGNDYAMGGVSYYPYRYLMVTVYDDWTVIIEGVDPDTGGRVYGMGATYQPSIGLSPVWNATGAEPRLASDAGNWDNGVPTAGETTIFSNVSVLNCTWDIDVENSLYLRPGWTGYINQTANTTFQDFFLWDGWYNPSPDNRTVILGNGVAQGTQNTRITNETFRVEFSGDYVKYGFPYLTPALKELIISGNVQQTGHQFIHSTGIGINVTGTLYINPNIAMTVYPYENSIFSGTIKGPGAFKFDALLYGTGDLPEITGSIECDYIHVKSENSRTWELSRDLTLGGELRIEKTVGGWGNAFKTMGHDLNIGGLYTSAYVTLFANDTEFVCDGDWNTHTGIFYVDDDIVLTGDDCYITFGAGRMASNLELYGTPASFFIDVPMYLEVPTHGMSLEFDIDYSTTINITLPVESKEVLTYKVNSTDESNIIATRILGLDGKYEYIIYEDGVLFDAETEYIEDVLPTRITIFSVGNHTYQIMIYGPSFDFTDDSFREWITTGNGLYTIFAVMGGVGLIAGAPLALIFYKNGREDGAGALVMAIVIIIMSVCFLMVGLAPYN